LELFVEFDILLLFQKFEFQISFESVILKHLKSEFWELFLEAPLANSSIIPALCVDHCKKG